MKKRISFIVSLRFIIFSLLVFISVGLAIMNPALSSDTALASDTESKVSLNLANAAGEPGSLISVPITLESNGYMVGSVALDLDFDPSVLSNPAARLNGVIAQGTAIDRLLISHTPAPGLFRLAVIPNYNNPESIDKIIPDGLVTTVTFSIAGNAPLATKVTITNNPSSCTPLSQALATVGSNSVVNINYLSTDLDQDGYTLGEGDCDDSKSSVFPGANEVFDGLDNDCDGYIDEGIDLLPQNLEDVSEVVEVISGSPVTGSGTITYQVSLKNNSDQDLYPPVIAVVYANLNVLNPDGQWIDNQPYFDYTRQLSSLVFKAKATTGSKPWIFQASATQGLQFQVKLYARRKPVGWLPLTGILQEKAVQYTVSELTTGDFSFKAVSSGLNLKEIKYNETIYQQFLLPQGRLMGETGKPGLPGFTRLVAVPRGAKMLVEVSEGSSQTFDGALIAPIQPHPEDNREWQQPAFTIEQNFYQSITTYPESLVSVEYDWIRGCKVALVHVHTARYNPGQKKLFYYPEVQVDIHFEGGDDTYIPLEKRSRFFEGSYGMIIANYGIVKADVFDLVTRGPLVHFCDLLIITPAEFEAQAEDLADWKREKGFITNVVTLDDINTDQGGTTADDIRAYIRDVYDYQNISYVLLLGDAEFIPPHYVTPHPTGHNGTLMGTDLYYAQMDDTGYFPDLAIGRIPVDTVEEAQTVVNKIITYEKTPPFNSDFYRKVLCGSYFQDDNNNGRTERGFTQTIEEIRDFFLDKGFSSLPRQYTTNSTTPRWYEDGTSIPDELEKPDFSWDGNADDIEDEINSGSLLVLHRDHGDRSGWSDPDFDTGDLPGLTNGSLLPVVLSLNCQTGWFDNETDDSSLGTSTTSESFAEDFLKMSGGGAVGVIAATRNSPSYPNNDLMKAFLDCIWNDLLSDYPSEDDEEAQGLEGSKHLGDALNYAKFYISTQWSGVSECRRPFEIYHCLGDPTMELWTRDPNPILLIPDQIAFKPFQVRYTIPVEEDGVLVSLIQDKKIMAQGLSRNGQVILQLDHPLSFSDDTSLSIAKDGYYTRIQAVNMDSTSDTLCYYDADGDGFGDDTKSLQSSSCPDGYVTYGTDCNDQDNSIYPGAMELCDGKDNDCDQYVDEGFKLGEPCEGQTGDVCLFRAGIIVKGQEMGGAAHESEVFIGLAEAADTAISPPPPPGYYTVFVKLRDLWQKTKYYYVDVRQTGETTTEKWLLKVDINDDYADPSLPGYYPVLSWDQSEFCDKGYFRLWSSNIEGVPVSLLVEDMRLTESYQTGAENGQYFCITWSSETTAEIDLLAGWNMISLPVLPDSTLLSYLFPEAVAVYSFDQVYHLVEQGDELEPGIGYWLYLNEPQTYYLTGTPIDSYSFEAESGWSMIGSCSQPARVWVSNGNIEAIYGFETTYQLVSSDGYLEPGEGYWIYLHEPDHVTVTSTEQLSRSKDIKIGSQGLKTRGRAGLLDSISISWSLNLMARGQAAEGASHESMAIIGLAETPVSSLAPPPLPGYTVDMKLKDTSITQYYYKEIKSIESDRQVWILKVEIGDYADPDKADYYPVLSWDPNEIGFGSLELRCGKTETGELLIPDMRNTNTYQTKSNDGTDGNLWYTIIFEIKEICETGQLGLKNKEGVPINTFEDGLNLVGMEPLCADYDSYTFLKDRKEQGSLVSIHVCTDDEKESGSVASTYWFFEQLSGKRFMLGSGEEYRVFLYPFKISTTDEHR